MMSDSHHSLWPTTALLGLVLVNILIIVGLFPNAIPAIATPQIFVLVALELPIVFWIYWYTKRKSVPGLLE